MPAFGENSHFAAEFQLDRDHAGEWMFGHFCYWCAGYRIGDYNTQTSLRDVLFQLEQVTKDTGRRTNPRFLSMSASEVFRLIDCALFAGDDAEIAAMAENEQWARHNFVPAVDVFDRWKAFLVEGGTTARVVYACAPYARVSDFSLQAGEVDVTLNAVCDALRKVYESH